MSDEEKDKDAATPAETDDSAKDAAADDSE